MKNVIMLSIVLLSFTACNTTQFDLDLFEQVENPRKRIKWKYQNCKRRFKRI